MSTFDMGKHLAAVSKDLAELIEARGAFVRSYCNERGWNPDDLTIDQLLEVRAQKGWKEPIPREETR